MSEDRFVYLGYQFEEYIGWNSPFGIKTNTCFQLHCQFNTFKLEQFWEKAWITVKGLLIMDCLNIWAHDRFTSRGLTTDPFDFGF